MKLVPLTYKRFERDPAGCYTASLTNSGWQKSMFVHTDPSRPLLSDEVNEFVHLIYEFTKTCSDFAKFERYFARYGTRLPSDGCAWAYAFNVRCERMDYTFRKTGNDIEIYPYRRTN